MSTIAARQIQMENNDINNLWHWPSSGYTGGYHPPTSQFIPEYMKWMSASDTGYISNYNSNLCHFTEHSVSSKRSGGYQANVFLDINPGKYTMYFDCNVDWAICFDKYIRIDDKNIKFGKSKITLTGKSGTNKVDFEIPDYVVMMVHFYGIPEGTWATFTNIKII